MRTPLLAALVAATPLFAQRIPSPQSHLGFRPGADSTLANYEQIGGYLSALAVASPFVELDTIGHTTMGRPMLMVTLASPTNMARLAQLRRWQARLADPRGLTPAGEDSLVAAAPAVVLINNNIHSTEIASSQMAMVLAYRLAADTTWRRYLDRTVVLLVPSANPDGLDTVVTWYRGHKGTRYEGGPLPWLYHPYVGHDDNRDWYMLTQVETRNLTRVLYRDWFPEVVWDAHQMGNRGARLFLPPFNDPVNPNLDPMLVEAINLTGTAMASAVLDAGKTGVVHQQEFDLWWHGGFRTVPARHNMVGILSEAASARIASPIFQSADSLHQPPRGVNYPAPWPGGWWRMGDIVRYELLAARGLLGLVSSEREQFVRRFITLGRRAIRTGETEAPAAFVIPRAQRDPWAAATLVNALIARDIDVRRASDSVHVAGRTFGPGSWVIPLAQPARADVKDLLEVQHYPDRHRYPGGPAIPPYDVAGWTLGLQMGVEVVTAESTIAVPPVRAESAAVVPGHVSGRGPVLLLRNAGNGESRAIAEALQAGARVWVREAATRIGNTALPAGAVAIEPHGPRLRATLAREAARYGFDVWATSGLEAPASALERLPRIGLYKPWTANLSEGWTRWVLEQFGIPYASVTDSIIRAGGLRNRFDVLILPDERPNLIMSGHSLARVPKQYSGGIGDSGRQNVAAFVESGGTLVTLGSSSDFAISALNLPVTNVLAGDRTGPEVSHFYAPGSIFGAALEPGTALTSGMGDSVAVFFANGDAFDVAAPGRVIAKYADDPLRSGYVQHPEAVAGKAAVAEVAAGRGRVILFGFQPQHRGQTHATFKLLFNAVLLGSAP